ncbi:hypothetical protein D6C91_01622 [Aureobasidium pullulans]|uniref:Ribosomal protein S16 n=1 Tax=Aureobasidium pullulans TaxID=5580 RepID=A0A4S9TWW4_AURPU|nr:hypothetical protein D6C91_01622 [Aureobasidium pullulans]
MLVFSFIRSRLVLAGFPESSLQRRTYESPQKESRIVDETSDLAATKHITTHNMVLKIRLARFGKRHAPFYNIVVAHARTARGSKPLEVLGTYDPIPKTPIDSSETAKKFKDIKLDIDRAKYWLGVGAQPSEPAWRLLSMVSRHKAKEQGLSVWSE